MGENSPYTSSPFLAGMIGKRNLFDYDNDGVPNIWDCQPKNKYRQDSLTQPARPEIPNAPRPEDYGVNAPGIIGTAEQQNRIAEWRRATEAYNQQKQDIFKRYQEQVQNYQQQQEKYESEKKREDELIKQIQSQSPNRFKPIYSNGQLTGFEDVRTGTSVPLQQFYQGYSAPQTFTPQQKAQQGFFGSAEKHITKSGFLPPPISQPTLISTMASIQPNKYILAEEFPKTRLQKLAEQAERPFIYLGQKFEKVVGTEKIKIVEGATSIPIIEEGTGRYLGSALVPKERKPINIFGGGIATMGTIVSAPVRAIDLFGGLAVSEQRRKEYEAESGKERIIKYGGAAASLYIAGNIASKGVSKIKAASEVSAIEKAPTAMFVTRTQKEEMAVDAITGLQKVGKEERFALIAQPSYMAGETRFTLEGGKGISFFKKGEELNVLTFESGGRGVIPKELPALTRTKLKEPFLFSEQVKETKTLPEAKGSFGRIFIKPTSEAKLKIGTEVRDREIFGFIRGESKVIPKGKSVWENFIGVSKEGEAGLTTFITAKPTRVSKFDILTERATFSGEPTGAGLMKTKAVGDVKRVMDIGGDKIVFSKQFTAQETSKLAPAYSSLIKQSFKAQVKQPASLMPKETQVSISLISPGLKKEQAREAQVKPAFKDRQEVALFSPVKLGQASTEEVRIKDRFGFGYGLSIGVREGIREKEKQGVAVMVNQVQAQRQEQRQGASQGFGIFSPIPSQPELPGRIPLIPPFFLPDFRLTSGEYGKRGTRGRKQIKYTPTLSSIFGGVSSKRKQETFATGFEAFRPVEVSRRRRQKNKSLFYIG